jgi:hypothetical protein
LTVWRERERVARPCPQPFTQPSPAARDRPVAAALRHEEQQSAKARVAVVRKAVSRAPAHVQSRILDYLVAQRQVELSAVERAMRAYWVLG